MVLYMGLHRPGDHEEYREWPVFQVIPGLAVLCCPRCNMRLKLDHCREVGEPREEEGCEKHVHQVL
ncbi:MAG: hypothetical protein GWN58_21145 [Anaerolineae bacterium]|nr:hypothetical protein [Anaerolineae bacterium]